MHNGFALLSPHCPGVNTVRYCNAPLQVTHWPKGDYGKFYDGDSYVVLRTYKKNPSGEVSTIVYVCDGLQQSQQHL